MASCGCHNFFLRFVNVIVCPDIGGALTLGLLHKYYVLLLWYGVLVLQAQKS